MATPDGGPPRLRLDADLIVETVAQLQARIDQRFETRGINRRAADLLRIAERARQRAATIGEPIRLVRVCLVLLAIVFLVGLFVLPFDLSSDTGGGRDAFEWLQILEAGLNDVVLIGAGAFFLVTVETRMKRHRCLSELHELRSYAHVIDMMQLTKDPQRGSDAGHDTPASPTRDLTSFELSRYLDYCSELLSLTGKLAATPSARSTARPPRCHRPPHRHRLSNAPRRSALRAPDRLSRPTRRWPESHRHGC